MPTGHCADDPPPTEVACEVACAADCVVGSWSPWSPCSHSCATKSAEGRQSRTRTVLAMPGKGTATLPISSLAVNDLSMLLCFSALMFFCLFFVELFFSFELNKMSNLVYSVFFVKALLFCRQNCRNPFRYLLSDYNNLKITSGKNCRYKGGQDVLEDRSK